MDLSLEASWFLEYEVYTGTATVLDLDMRPPEGELWAPLWVRGNHDDPAGRNLSWQMIYPTGVAGLMTPVATAASVYRFLHDDINFRSFRLVTNRNIYVRIRADALAAGKKLYLAALVYKLRGIPVREDT